MTNKSGFLVEFKKWIKVGKLYPQDIKYKNVIQKWAQVSAKIF